MTIRQRVEAILESAAGLIEDHGLTRGEYAITRAGVPLGSGDLPAPRAEIGGFCALGAIAQAARAANIDEGAPANCETLAIRALAQTLRIRYYGRPPDVSVWNDDGSHDTREICATLRAARRYAPARLDNWPPRPVTELDCVSAAD